MRSILLVATLAFACGGEQSKPSEPTPEPVIDNAEPAKPVERESDAGATAPAASDECVKECVASRQMQATSIEQIESDCQARCAGGGAAPSIDE